MFSVLWVVLGSVTILLLLQNEFTHFCVGFSIVRGNYYYNNNYHSKNIISTSSSTVLTARTQTYNDKNHKQLELKKAVEQKENRAREYCSGCQRPLIQCLCEYLPAQRIALPTQVLVLQHPEEFRRKTISTVPLLKLVLENCQVLVGRSFENNIQLDTIVNDAHSTGRIPILLFPGSDAITLEDPNAISQLEKASYDKHQRTHENIISDNEQQERENVMGNQNGQYGTTKNPSKNNEMFQNQKYLLILIDGTWTQAKHMLRDSPTLLRECHPVQFNGTSNPSMYDSIRKQPRDNCLSTLESCVRTLLLLEPCNPHIKIATKHLLDSLRALIQTQISHELKSLRTNPNVIRNVSKFNAKIERRTRNESKLYSDTETNKTVQIESETYYNVTKLIGKDKKFDPSQKEATTQDVIDDASIHSEKYKLRPLKGLSDAKYVDSRWPYRSNKSLKMIEKQIHADNVNATQEGKCQVCWGMEYRENDDTRSHHLVACILRHRNGAIGILHVDDEHRRRGLGSILLKQAVQAIQINKEPAFAFIVDGNKSSEALFTKLGWMKADPMAKKGTGKRKAKRLWILDSFMNDNDKISSMFQNSSKDVQS